MTTLYIDRRGYELELDSGALAVRKDGELLKRLPVGLIERVVVASDILMSTRLMAALCDQGVGLLLYNARSGARAAFVGAPGGDARRRLGQAKMALQENLRSLWARRWVQAKALGQARLLRLEAERRPAVRAAILPQVARIDNAATRLRREELSVETTRGLEGAASAAYFEGLQHLFAQALGFHGRNRRPPQDPVNATLSLAYTLLYGAAVEAIAAAGLDPGLGYLHDPAHGRAALACDLMEPLRPAADQLVATLFRERTLRHDHFQQKDGACLLGKAGRRTFYEQVEQPMERFRNKLRALARVVARAADAAARDLPIASAEPWGGEGDPENEAAVC